MLDEQLPRPVHVAQLAGFDNLRVIGPVRYTLDAIPFTTYLNLDKPLAGFWLLLVWPALRLHRGAWSWARGLLVGLVTAAVVLGVAFLFGEVAMAPKWPDGAWLWAINNLLIACLTVRDRGAVRRSTEQDQLAHDDLCCGDSDAVSLERVVLHPSLDVEAVALADVLLGQLREAVPEGTVATRSREIAVRVALGARHRDVARAVYGHALRIVAIGVIAGLAASWVTARLMASFLYGARAASPLFAVLAVLALGAVSIVAAAVQLRRALHVQPHEALVT